MLTLVVNVGKYCNLLKAAAMASALLLTACGKNSGEDTRSELQHDRITMLVDSIGYASPKFMAICDSLLSLAKDSADYYELFATKGMRYTIANPADSMLYYADKTLVWTNSISNMTPRIMGIKSRGYALKASYYHTMRQDNDSAIIYFTKAYSTAMQSDIIYNAPNMAANLGDAYVFRDDLPNAAQWYRRALYVADSLNLPERSIASINMGLGRIYTQLQDYGNAQKYYEDADARFNMMKYNMQVYFLNNYGNLYYFSGDYLAAKNMFLRMKRLIEDNGGDKNINDISLCKINLADVYLNLGNTDSAQILIDEIEPFYRKYNVESAIYYIGTIKIGIAVKKGQLDRVKQIVSGEHYKFPIEQSMKGIRARYMKQYYSLTGDYRKALELTELTQAEEDSMAHNKMNMRSMEIMMRFTADTLKLHHEMAINKKNEEVMTARVTVMIIILALVTVMLSSAYMFIYIKKRRLQLQLKVINLRQENIRQRISPHFVFNVLNQQIGLGGQKDDNTLVELSKLIRRNLELLGKSSISLKEELDFVDSYVTIEQKLIGESLHYCKDIRCDIQQLCLPPMLVQILVENAIKHGLKAIDKEKHLTIRVIEDNDDYSVTVEDNGKGYDCRIQSPNSTATGLNVIRQMITFINGGNKSKMHFGITNITDDKGNTVGCKATLKIPKNISFNNFKE